MLTLNDGRDELWQWDTGRRLTVDADCSQVHFSNKVFGRSVDVDVVDGTAAIPDVLLQVDKELIAWAFVGTAENGYTKISKVFKVKKRNKPADYVFTPPEQTTLQKLVERLTAIEESQDPDAIKNAVDDYLANNPIKVEEKDPTVPEWAKQPTPPDVKIPDKLPNPHSITFTGAVNASYDGSDHVEITIPGSGGNVGLTLLDPEEGEVFTAIVPEPALTGISVSYTGGDVVIGTALTALVGIVVTASYSNGTTKTVTDYTLSGEIAEGSNTITVTYEGMTATFTVMGVEEEPEVTLTSISATYTGGNVAVGTAVSALTGITVTAHYSDGSTEPVTGYTLSGTIAEGSNTITVSYGGMTTTFVVTGEAEETVEVKVFEPVIYVEDGFINTPLKRWPIAYSSSWSSDTHAMYQVTHNSNIAAISSMADVSINGMNTVAWGDREKYDECCIYYNATAIWIRVPKANLTDTTVTSLLNYLRGVNKDVIRLKYNEESQTVSIDESAVFSNYSEITYDAQMENTICFKVLTNVTGYNTNGNSLSSVDFKVLDVSAYTVLQTENAIKLKSDGYLEMLLEPGVIPESSLEAVKSFIKANPITLYNVTAG